MFFCIKYMEKHLLKKLINGNKTMTEMFEQLKNQTEDEEV